MYWQQLRQRVRERHSQAFDCSSRRFTGIRGCCLYISRRIEAGPAAALPRVALATADAHAARGQAPRPSSTRGGQTCTSSRAEGGAPSAAGSARTGARTPSGSRATSRRWASHTSGRTLAPPAVRGNGCRNEVSGTAERWNSRRSSVTRHLAPWKARCSSPSVGSATAPSARGTRRPSGTSRGNHPGPTPFPGRLPGAPDTRSAAELARRSTGHPLRTAVRTARPHRPSAPPVRLRRPRPGHFVRNPARPLGGRRTQSLGT